ncbi:MAG: hypothetical protein B7Y15_10800, partial [Bacteroidetes bacterium 24-39-8]
MKQKKAFKGLILIFALFSLLNPSFSQNKVIKGMIQDEKKNPVVSATIRIKGTKITSVSDNSGNFSIVAPSNKETLVISFIGFETSEIVTTTDMNSVITLKTTTTSLDNVVVNALGFETKKDKLGYATNRITGESLTNSGETGLMNALAGKSSGVRVSRSSGDPGGASQILIRGQSTITRSTDPLIVLDGIPISGDARNESSGGQIVQQSRLNDISPDDISSMQILKGASAAALWGTRAANGVIIITTKKGSSGSKANITIKSTVSFDEVSAYYDLQNTYGQGNNGVWASNAIRTWGDKIANRSGQADAVNNTGGYFVGNTGKTIYPITTKNSKETFVDKNYQDIFRTGYFIDNSLTISGGDTKSNFFISFNDLNQKGVARNSSDYRRTGLRVNVGREMNKWLNISNKASY